MQETGVDKNLMTINMEKTHSNALREMAFKGNIKPYLDFFAENILKRLSNRDLTNLDEKHIKSLLHSSMFSSGLYSPVSEKETAGAYTGIYLQRHPTIPDVKFEYVLEIKYAKTEAQIKAKLDEARTQIEKYRKDPRFVYKDEIRFIALVFNGKREYECPILFYPCISITTP